MESADLTGAVLDGRYQVLEPIAKGAMGTVYRAERLKLGKIVAVKVLHDELPDELSSRKRFEIEAMAMAKLEHPNCAAVLDVGVHDGRPFVVMDFITGSDLKSIVDEGPVPIPRAISITRQVLSGLAHAHELGIIHRDIKPANIILGQKAGLGDHVKILDFGLARLQAEQVSKLTTGIVVGTPAYMAPEQIRGTAIDARADLYASGVLLFELLTGKKPFSSPKDDPIEVVSMHLKHPVPRLDAMLPGTDFGELEAVIARALQKAAGDRYQTATEFVAALDATQRAIEQSQAISAMTSQAINAMQIGGTSSALEISPSMMIPAGETRLGIAAHRATASTTQSGVPAAPNGTATSGPVIASTMAPSRTTTPGMASAPAPMLADNGPPAPSTDAARAIAALSPAAFVQRAPADEPFTGQSSPLISPVVPTRPDTDPMVHLPPVPLGASPAPSSTVSRKHLALAGGAVLLVILVIAAATRGSDKPSSAAPVATPSTPSGSSPTPGVVEPPPRPEIEMTGDDPPTEQGVLDFARAEITARRTDSALALVNRSRGKYPQNGELPFIAGTLHFQKQQWAEGLKMFREAIAIDPLYATNGDFIKAVVTGFATTPAYNADIARFLRDEIGSPAEAYLDEVATTHASPEVRKRAADELRAYQP